ncbi:MAG: DUF2180 family protein [Methanomicrobiales archaeon]
MKCYVCAKEGKESDAVAVCVACGMGTCMKHTIRREVEVWEGEYPLPSRKLPKKMPRMLCPDCNAAYGDGKQWLRLSTGVSQKVSGRHSSCTSVPGLRQSR